LVDTVIFIGAPVPSNREHWQLMRTVVAGKMFNVYSENDLLLAFLYRATSIQLGVAGLQEIKGIDGVENINLSSQVQGHMRYAKLLAKIIARCGVPVVKGTDGPIEEDDDIKLSDSDRDNATLIDLDGLNIGGSSSTNQDDPPPKYTPRPEPRQSMAQPSWQRSTVSRSQASVVSANQDLLGLDLSDFSTPSASTTAQTTAKTTSQAVIQSRPAPNPPRLERSAHPSPRQATLPSAERPSPAYAAPTRTMSSASAPAVPPSQMPAHQRLTPPALTSSHSYSVADHADDDSDEEGGMGIRMVDNDDGGLEYCDPTPMEEGFGWR
jgi:hypothetical protein